MTPVTYTNLNKLLLIRDIQEIAKTYINDDRSYRWIWKNKIAYIKAILIIPNPITGSAGSRIFLFIATYSNTQV